MPAACSHCGAAIERGVEACPVCGRSQAPTLTCAACDATVRKDDELCYRCGVPAEHQIFCWRCAAVVSTRLGNCPACAAPQPSGPELLHQAAAQEAAALPFPDRRRAHRRRPLSRSIGPTPGAGTTFTPDADHLKIATVLFADVSGFTKMSESLHPEEVKDIMNECFAGLTAAITSHGGTVDKYIGDCVMALFGALVVHDNDAERAVAAAVAMQRFLHVFSDRLRVRAGICLAMRVGINSGQVLAGYVGQGDNASFTVMGDTVNLASRIEHACPVGSILISHETYRMVRGLFRVEVLAPIEVKGKSRAIRVVEVLGPNPGGIELAEPTFFGLEIKMAGREEEAKRLRAALVESREHRWTGVALVSGPAGMGKIRLVKSVVAAMADEVDTRFDFLRCHDYLTQSAFDPLLDLLRSLIAVGSDESPEAVIAAADAFTRGLSVPDETREFVVSAIAHLLGVEASRLGLLAPVADDPEQLEGMVREGILAFFRARASAGPLVVAVQNAPVASRSFLSLLSDLAAREDGPLFLVLTGRDEDMLEQHFGWHERCLRIHLPPLNEAESVAMVRDLLRSAEPIPPEIIRRIVTVSGGRPLLIEEISADLVERGVVTRGEKRWDIDMASARDIPLPQSVEAAVLSRVEALPPAINEALQIASVVGDVCWEGLLSHLGIVDAGAAVADLCRRRFVEARRFSRIRGDREFTFVLRTVREAMERHVLRKVKVELHRSIARWLEDKAEGQSAKLSRLLAHHHREGGDHAAALPHMIDAAHEAERDGDTGQALEDLLWIWEHARGEGEELLVDPVELARTRVSVARLLRRVGRTAEAATSYDETRELFAGRGEQEPTIDQLVRRAGLETARSLIQRGERQAARALLAEALAGLDQAAAPGKRLAAAILKQEGWISYLESHFGDSLAFYDKGIALVETMGPTAELASLLDGRGVCFGRMKRFDQAEKALVRSLELSRDIQNRAGEATAFSNLGVLRYRQGILDQAAVEFEKAEQVSESIGDIVQAAICRTNSADVLLERGDLATARSRLERALVVFARTKSREHQATALQSLIQCLRGLGDRGAERDRVVELTTVADEIGDKEIQRRALIYASRLAAEEEDLEAVNALLETWRALGEATDGEQEELLAALGNITAKLGR